MKYDIIIIGSGPGGYVAAIRASKLGMKTAVVERESLGGICLNWGCIPTKALLKSALVFNYMEHASDYGITVSGAQLRFQDIITRSRDVAGGMSKGVSFLMKKNKIDVIYGTGKLDKGNKVIVTDGQGIQKELDAKHVVLAVGAHARELPSLKIDGKRIIGYRQAMNLEKQPSSMIVVGSGAIGAEFAWFYQTLGTKVTLVELLPNILPIEDEEVSRHLERSFRKTGMEIYTGTSVESVNTAGGLCEVHLKTSQGIKSLECETVLSAVGIAANIENIGLEEAGVNIVKGKIGVDDFYCTNVSGIYAIGDCIPGPALAHVASAEGIICVEKIAGLNPEPLNYNNVPSCTYCQPEVASVGFTEKAAKDAGYQIKMGKFPFSASGKANAAGHKDGFVKVIFDEKYDEFLGAHMIGNNVTELIAEVVVARKLEATGHEILKSVHPHPTLSEAIMEATAAAYGETIHL